jgi:hypothetical protein
LSRFLGTETDPATKLDSSFKVDQEGSRKDVERRCGVLEIIFFALTHTITLHHRNGIYYLVLFTVLLHNMMVEEHVSNNEVEDGSMYNTIDPNGDGDTITDDDDEDASGYERNPLDRWENSRWHIGGGKSCMTTKVLKTKRCSEETSLQD